MAGIAGEDKTVRKTRRTLGQHIQKNMIAGVLTLFPIVVTAVVFIWSLGILSDIGEPAVRAMARLIEVNHPTLAALLENSVFINIVSVLVVFTAIYLIGWLASQFIGARLLGLFNGLMERIPFVRQVYGAMSTLLQVLQQRPDNIKRVVMIEFPHTEMKTIGFVTRTLRDQATGQELAAVFVPTTPNPSSGYLEIVPLDRLVSTELSFEEAMNFIVSGGAIAPETIAFSRSAPRDEKRGPPSSG
jgi:uncharacterized membrane protein